MKIRLLGTIAEARAYTAECRRSRGSLALVPTMGALHAGHGALMDRARREADGVVASIFVNPTQFDRADDYQRYTRDLEGDLAFADERGVDAVFAPSAEEMYPARAGTFIEVPVVSERLCGEFRPGHFRGVATVVMKLLQIVQPDFACFGEKDAQQLAVIRRMVRDLNVPVTIVPVPTVREPDGLALSSRNQRLSAEERRVAPVLYQALEAARRQLQAAPQDVAAAREAGLAVLRAEPRVRVEYFEVADAEEMQPVSEARAPARVAAAVWLGATRLIDNVGV